MLLFLLISAENNDDLDDTSLLCPVLRIGGSYPVFLTVALQIFNCCFAKKGIADEVD